MLIIPIENIDKVYPGGFKKIREDNLGDFSKRLWNDDFLFRDGAMSPMDIEFMIKKWEDLGLVGVIEKEGQKQWKDYW